MNAERAIRAVVLYPEIMDVYADRGNLTALRARCKALGVALEVANVGLGDPLPSEADLVLIGGGQDAEQQRVAPDLFERGPTLRRWVEEGAAALAICGGYQLFGQAYRTGAGEELPGIGVFDVTTVAPPLGWERCIGDVLAESIVDDVGDVVGFENHGGRTYLGPRAAPFARVHFGYGNNGDDPSEGAVYREAIGTYLHGPVLPKNPRLLDRLILAALRHRYGPDEVLPETPMDQWAVRAHARAAEVAQARGRPRS